VTLTSSVFSPPFSFLSFHTPLFFSPPLYLVKDFPKMEEVFSFCWRRQRPFIGPFFFPLFLRRSHKHPPFFSYAKIFPLSYAVRGLYLPLLPHFIQVTSAHVLPPFIKKTFFPFPPPVFIDRIGEEHPPPSYFSSFFTEGDSPRRSQFNPFLFCSKIIFL